MANKFAAVMHKAAALTRAFNVFGATRMIQRALAKSVASRLSTPSRDTPSAEKPVSKVSARLRRPLGEILYPEVLYPEVLYPKVLDTLKTARESKTPVVNPGHLLNRDKGKPVSNPAIPMGARFVSQSFTCSAGTRGYKLYVPAAVAEKPNGLILMLHGCTQNPDDFAAGTTMNAHAERHGLLIAYPEQTRLNNASSCWNWFEESHQLRGAGEPAILAGLASKLIKEFNLDEDKVFVAGLSAGAAMAVILGKTYPDLFQAVGVHSGLAYKSAGNVMSALAVMRGRTGASLFGISHSQEKTAKSVRTIIFQGSADRTVNPSNAQRILDAVYVASNYDDPVVESGSVNGRRFTRTIIANKKSGHTIAESWLVHGASHTWSGGNISGSYTDAKGPDASAEMLRFFLKAK